jgi:hypothetical protein
LVALFVLAALVIINGQGCSPHRQVETRSGSVGSFVKEKEHDLPIISHLQDMQRKEFAIFRTMPEGLPPFVTHILRQPIYGLNWSLSQRIPLKKLAAIWAVPGNGFICLVSSQTQERQLVGVTCNATKQIVKRSLFTAFLAPSSQHPASAHRLIVGIAPDLASKVLAQTGINTVSIPVSHNVFVRSDEAARPPDQIAVVR